VLKSQNSLDLALLAYILRGAFPVTGKIKLQKTGFFSEFRLKERGLVGPHFRFIRYHRGPFSGDLEQAGSALAQHGFTHSTKFELTKRGQELSDLIAELKRLPENRVFFRTLDATLEHCKNRNGDQLMEDAYNLEMFAEGDSEKRKIRDIPLNTVLIAPPDRSSLVVPVDLKKLIDNDLLISEEDVRRAEKKDLPKAEEEYLRRLIGSDRRSA